MENWRAGLIGVGIVLIGFGGYSSLEGVWKGLSLVAAGIALVLLGLSLERGPRAETEPSVGEVSEAEEDRGDDLDDLDDLDVTAPLAAVAAEQAEATEPIVRLEPEPAMNGPEPLRLPESEPTAMAAEEASAAVVVDEIPTVEESAEEDGTGHRHDQPMLGHSELVSHIRDYHQGVPFDGSTIQLRLLHERAHG